VDDAEDNTLSIELFELQDRGMAKMSGFKALMDDLVRAGPTNGLIANSQALDNLRQEAE
jgi:hypothetical protein